MSMVYFMGSFEPIFPGKPMNIKTLITYFLVLVGSAAQACQFDSVTFDDNFSAARLDGCKQLSDTQYRLQIEPENRPINSSPWYAFKVKSPSAKSITVEMVFDGDAPRYLPKVSKDGDRWQSIPFEINNKVMSIELDVDSQDLWVAGQEIIDNQDYDQWLDKFNPKGIRKELLGKSTQGRDIKVIYSERNNSKEWLVFLGRQHPPEITGALAMFPFVESLFEDNELAKAFRQRFNLLIVLNINPDGVEEGNWRHNVNGLDLNRDWRNFSQVETQLIRDAIADIHSKGDKLVFAMDFHSTRQDVFYTMPSDYALAPSMLVVDWLADLKRVVGSNFTVRNAPGSSPDKGVFKQFIADTYKVQGVTYEMGDNTDRELIKFVAVKAAETLMDKMLKTPSEDFYYKKSAAVSVE